MKFLLIFSLFLSVCVCTVSTASSAPPKMRPYVGLGVLLLPNNISGFDGSLILYKEPALSRIGPLNKAKLPSFDWIFGANTVVQPLIVMERKGAWMQVAYDEAGREAWLQPPRQVVFQGWDLFFKGHVSRLLPGLQKQYYQLFQQPGLSPMSVLTIKEFFRVLRLEDDWAMVLTEQKTLGWLRWRDGDGRLLIGILPVTVVPHQ